MRGNRRARAFYNANVFLTRLAYLSACVTLTSTEYNNFPIEIKLWDTGRTPLAHMVDVTNGFGLKVLAEHNFLNENNIAFSPYGLMGIMVALYEGVDGESSYQIQRGMQLPWKRNIMRIGFRDIHRTLKTYFVPEEGFLAGLALNNENVTFNEHYKKILRFYGFDLENDQLPKLSPETNNTSNGTSAATSTMSPAGSGDISTTTMIADTTSLSPNREETTTTKNPDAETISTIDIREGGSTTASSSLEPNAESTPISTIAIGPETTTNVVTEMTPLTVITTQTSAAQAKTTTAMMTTQAAATTTQAPTTTTQAPVTTTQSLSTTSQVTTTTTLETSTLTTSVATATETASLNSLTSAITNEPSTNNEVDTSPVDMSTSELSTTQSTINTTPSTPQVTTDGSISTSMVTESASTFSESVTTTSDLQQSMSDATTNVAPMIIPSTLETLERRKKSVVDFIFTNPPYVDDYLYYRSFDIGEANSPAYHDNVFLANGLKSVQVTYMQYDTVLEHAYLPHLEASALRLMLDSDRYYLLVVLPSRGGTPALDRLLSRMARESDLSDIYSMLRPRRVKGTVPSFTVKGHITLTTDLQKLGIRDVFEPRQRDFTLMTKQPGVYVRSIEQAVSVAIRKYRPDDQKKHRYVTNREPVFFSATYPFLYFVMDANIHVALMAGKMVDPLNSRIL